ncbi:MAG TPA: DUF4411 family protein [Candidatus Kapabacteria bacterium]|nr:DUF4411 family protein [Candidatus Kapabacteria bacterium]
MDANVLIQAWQFYYSPKFCPDYWSILNDIGHTGIIFLPENVFEEITKTDDDLAEWLRESSIEKKPIDEEVTKCLQKIYDTNPLHKFLVDNRRNRSLADPWVIAHAMKENACVVTKEGKVTAPSARNVRIPNVCENMNVRWVNDSDFVAEIGVEFSARLKR